MREEAPSVCPLSGFLKKALPASTARLRFPFSWMFVDGMFWMEAGGLTLEPLGDGQAPLPHSAHCIIGDQGLKFEYPAGQPDSRCPTWETMT